MSWIPNLRRLRISSAAVLLCCLISLPAATSTQPGSSTPAGSASGGDDGSTAVATRTLRHLVERTLASYVFVAGGSGVVIAPEGLVLTNHHVIAGENRSSLRVRQAHALGGRSWPVTVLGTDPIGDLALLRIDIGDSPALRQPWRFAPLAPASALVPGQEVLAIGNPFGLGDPDGEPTLTWGVLSTGRLVRGNYTDAVQGDAPVNPGNSGGPLFDLHGRLLGINGQIRTITGMRINSGIGLAISSAQIAAFLPFLKTADGGLVRHTAIPTGLRLAEIDGGGVRVAEVPSATRAGLHRPGSALASTTASADPAAPASAPASSAAHSSRSALAGPASGAPSSSAPLATAQFPDQTPSNLIPRPGAQPGSSAQIPDTKVPGAEVPGAEAPGAKAPGAEVPFALQPPRPIPLQLGDLLIAIADRPATSVAVAEGLFASLPWKSDGSSTIRVRIRRGDATLDLDVPTGRTPIPGKPYHGMLFAERRLAAITTVHISSVDPDSPAASAGIRVGERLTALNGRPIDARIAIIRALLDYEIGDRITLTLIADDGQERTITLMLAEDS